MPVTKLVMPGPFWAMQTPWRSSTRDVAVGHVGGVLLVRDRDEADAGRLEDVERVHVGGADDAEHGLDAVRGQGLDESLARRHAGHDGWPPQARSVRRLLAPVAAAMMGAGRAAVHHGAGIGKGAALASAGSARGRPDPAAALAARRTAAARSARPGTPAGCGGSPRRRDRPPCRARSGSSRRSRRG